MANTRRVEPRKSTPLNPCHSFPNKATQCHALLNTNRAINPGTKILEIVSMEQLVLNNIFGWMELKLWLIIQRPNNLHLRKKLQFLYSFGIFSALSGVFLLRMIFL